MTKTKLGAREYLYLWSYSLENEWSGELEWPNVLSMAVYCPYKDRIEIPYKDRGVFLLKVKREGSDSSDILLKHGISREEIDLKLKELLA